MKIPGKGWMKGLSIVWLAWALAVLCYCALHIVRERASYAQTITDVLAYSKRYEDVAYCARMAEDYRKSADWYSMPEMPDQHLPKSWSKDQIAKWRSERFAYASRKARQFANADWCEAEGLRLHYVAQVYGEMAMWRPVADAGLMMLVLAGAPLGLHGLVILVFKFAWEPIKKRKAGRTKKPTVP